MAWQFYLVIKMRESIIMKIHYGTALGAVALVAIHILFRMTQNFSESLQYQNVIVNYHLLPYALMLEVVLILLSVHGFNGLRVILLELKQGIMYEKMINYGSIGAMAALIAYGSRTILMAGMGMS
jgi:succinate dehydrogenase / fumarate reductase membrane anchor subunit